MEKDFDEWNALKKKLDDGDCSVYGYPREIWWCSLGINIGTEANGKNEKFERPVLIFKAYNKESMLVFPLTSKLKKDRFHFEVTISGINKDGSRKKAFVKLTQVRVISNKRLGRKIGFVSKADIRLLREELKKFL